MQVKEQNKISAMKDNMLSTKIFTSTLKNMVSITSPTFITPINLMIKSRNTAQYACLVQAHSRGPRHSKYNKPREPNRILRKNITYLKVVIIIQAKVRVCIQSKDMLVIFIMLTENKLNPISTLYQIEHFTHSRKLAIRASKIKFETGKIWQ